MSFSPNTPASQHRRTTATDLSHEHPLAPAQLPTASFCSGKIPLLGSQHQSLPDMAADANVTASSTTAANVTTAAASKDAAPSACTLGWRLKMTLLGMLFTTMVGLTAATPAHAMITVVDPSLIRENVMQRVLAIEQWARDNINQLEQITRLDTSNVILDGTQQLMTQNYAMDFKESWQQVKHLQKESLTLLHAAKSMWEEFGSSQHYYAAFHKAQAWENCMHQKHCTFATALNELHDKSITQAMQAFHNAEDMNAKLQAQIEQLQQLNIESQESTSAAGTLDAMSKINGHVASSMVDLNNQIAQLTKLQSHEMAQKNNEALAQDSYIRAITDFSDEIDERPIPYQLP